MTTWTDSTSVSTSWTEQDFEDRSIIAFNQEGITFNFNITFNGITSYQDASSVTTDWTDA
jgi:hypothetical protein